MKRTRLVSLASILVGTCLTSSASAMYHPTVGRFLQRDPVGHADGMNRYGYVQSAPVSAGDPSGLWTKIERDPKRPRAHTCAQANDTWSGLAQKIKLDDDEYIKWAKKEGGGPVSNPPTPGTWYTVPNVVVVVLGADIGQVGDYFPTGALARMHKLASQKAAEFTDFQVLTQHVAKEDLDKFSIQGFLDSPDLHAFIYGGHASPGGWGKLAYGRKKGRKESEDYTPPRKGGGVHHRLALVALYGCYTTQPSVLVPTHFNPKTTGEAAKGFVIWRTYVSRRGKLIGFPAGTRGKAEELPGGLRWEDEPSGVPEKESGGP